MVIEDASFLLRVLWEALTKEEIFTVFLNTAMVENKE